MAFEKFVGRASLYIGKNGQMRLSKQAFQLLGLHHDARPRVCLYFDRISRQIGIARAETTDRDAAVVWVSKNIPGGVLYARHFYRYYGIAFDKNRRCRLAKQGEMLVSESLGDEE